MCNALGPGSASEKELIRLMDTYGGTLFSLCRMMLRDHHRAQDAVQEIFIKAYKYMDQLPHLRNEKAWLIRIAINICHDMMRTAAPHTEDTSDSPLLEMVQNLPSKEREVVLLYYWQNLPPEEIASALLISRATVYRRLDHARYHLKIALEGGLPHD